MRKNEKVILGVRVDFLSTQQVLSDIQNKLLKDGKTHYICTTNPEFVMEAQENSEFRKIINSSDISIPDGVGLLFAGKYLDKVSTLHKGTFLPIVALVEGIKVGLLSGNEKLGDRVAGVDIADEVCKLSHKKGYSIFFLGGWPKNILGNPVQSPDYDLASLAAQKIKKKYPNVNIVGSSSQFSHKKRDDKKTLKYIKRCMKEKGVKELDFLFVAYGQPKQEKWIVRNKDKIPAKISVGLGGTFDFFTGTTYRCPKIIRKINLEWLFRLAQQPWRLLRVFRVFPIFPIKVYIESLRIQ